MGGDPEVCFPRLPTAYSGPWSSVSDEHWAKQWPWPCSQVTRNQITLSLFAPANTLAALLAMNFPEAGKVETQALMYAAVVLSLITLIVNVIGQAIITLTSQHRSAA